MSTSTITEPLLINQLQMRGQLVQSDHCITTKATVTSIRKQSGYAFVTRSICRKQNNYGSASSDNEREMECNCFCFLYTPFIKRNAHLNTKAIDDKGIKRRTKRKERKIKALQALHDAPPLR